MHKVMLIIQMNKGQLVKANCPAFREKEEAEMSKEQMLKKEIIKWVKTMNSDDPEQFNSCVMELEDMLLGYIEKMWR
ncbi:hypothetical protein WBS50_00045 [Bacillus paranthracis]|uniref:hypothetical protein n=2 Tax=Bacillus TaxID=1386 RepID=UPI0002FC24CB